jgi:hypothetical protein
MIITVLDIVMFSAQRLAVEGILMGQLDEFGDCTSLVFR